MRAPLREQDRNSYVRTDSKEKQVASNESETIKQWRRSWRTLMKASVIYFDAISNSHIEILKPYLASLGSRIQLFFDDRVTHVISETPNSHAAQTASSKGRKVYTVEKLTRFLNSIIGSGCDVSKPAPGFTGANSTGAVYNGANSPRLAQMLEVDAQAQMMQAGAHSSDWIGFHGPYILVWDPTLVNRPLCVKEWPSSELPTDGTWPQLRPVPLGYCPFIPRPVAKSEKRKAETAERGHRVSRNTHGVVAVNTVNTNLVTGAHTRTANIQDQSANNKENIISLDAVDERKKRKIRSTERSLPGLSNGRNNERALEPVYTTAAAATNLPITNTQISPEPLPNTNMAMTTAMTSVAPLAQNTKSTRLREFGEIVASGMQKYSQTSAKSGVAAGPQSREMANLRRKVLPKHPASTSASTTANTGIVPSQTAAQTPARHAKHDVRAVARKPGFCENCLQKYGDLTEHLRSASHAQFAKNEKKFASVDAIIEQLRRPTPEWAVY